MSIGNVHAPLLGLALECAESLPQELSGWMTWYRETEAAEQAAVAAASPPGTAEKTQSDNVQRAIAMVKVLSAPVSTIFIPRLDFCPATLPWDFDHHNSPLSPAESSSSPSGSSPAFSDSSTLTPPTTVSTPSETANTPRLGALGLSDNDDEQVKQEDEEEADAAMPREPTRNQVSNGLQYVAQKPAFLQQFGFGGGRRDDSDDEDDEGQGSSSRRGRDLPSRPKDGKWAGGSDDEGANDEKDGRIRDEWDEMYGGDDGPQVVVLKEGRHLSADELARERRKAAGLPSPPPADRPETDASKPTPTSTTDAATAGNKKPQRPTPAGAKRKLVGDAVASASADEGSKKKKKKKAVKGLLSFDEAEGEA
ncbi:uncharacterized protein EHS24_008709 [Apiotrichum porosum]|uniref:DUF4604 domain-containing protein n=1 Tax=Apiotrichum porosum TaxID=105984 RepID=A0A427XQX7_9TREE|nr:uncharacterized protein EHS24_008709 [Apiotrichum porosum]RSH81269.1 hypothetical protein EHS24_008709 [Apiotrichum porosum]